MNLTTKEYWDDSYVGADLSDQNDHSVAQFINKHLPAAQSKTAIELGSFPGSFLPTIGRKGYTLNGIDFNSRNETDVPAWLRSQKLSVGEFKSGDLFAFIADGNRTYDLVCSFGLIEHFDNFEEVILKHGGILKPGGHLVITTPNFRGFLQYVPHRLFDAYNLSKHNVKSMNPTKWKRLLEEKGYTVTYSGYFGGYSFWVDRTQKRTAINKLLLRVTEKVIYQFKKLFRFESSSFSAFCGIVAVKNK
jgi:2-polyprenyl-3-methyl-5-hydroxy-6-metoxy-1,4-benzoquinol methylase